MLSHFLPVIKRPQVAVRFLYPIAPFLGFIHIKLGSQGIFPQAVLCQFIALFQSMHLIRALGILVYYSNRKFKHYITRQRLIWCHAP